MLALVMAMTISLILAVHFILSGGERNTNPNSKPNVELVIVSITVLCRFCGLISQNEIEQHASQFEQGTSRANHWFHLCVLLMLWHVMLCECVVVVAERLSLSLFFFNW